MLTPNDDASARQIGSWRPVVVGIALAAITILLLLGWKRFMTWYIWGSAFTDLPGQDSLELALNVEPVVIAVITLVAGRLAGVFCRRRCWIAALIGVLPLLLLLLVAIDEGNPIHAVPWMLLICLVVLVGAYAPGLAFRRARGVRLSRPGTP